MLQLFCRININTQSYNNLHENIYNPIVDSRRYSLIEVNLQPNCSNQKLDPTVRSSSATRSYRLIEPTPQIWFFCQLSRDLTIHHYNNESFSSRFLLLHLPFGEHAAQGHLKRSTTMIRIREERCSNSPHCSPQDFPSFPYSFHANSYFHPSMRRLPAVGKSLARLRRRLSAPSTSQPNRFDSVFLFLSWTFIEDYKCIKIYWTVNSFVDGSSRAIQFL